MEANKDYIEKLDRSIGDYLDSPCEELHYDVLYSLFDGIINDYAVPCPICMYPDGVTCEPMFYHEKDKDYLPIFTQADGAEHPNTVALKLQGLIVALFCTEGCEGIVINPYADHKLIIPKMIFAYSFSAGSHLIAGEKEREKRSGIDSSNLSDSQSIKRKNSVKVRYHGKSSPIYFLDGEIYEVIGKQCGYWAIIDESGEDFLYNPVHFEVVEGNPNDLKEIPLSDFSERLEK